MDKQDAINMFGSVAAMAAALGITKNAIYMWPDPLPQHHIDRVVGAAIRLGKIVHAPMPAEGNIPAVE